MAFVGHGDAHDFTGSTITSLTMTYTSTAGHVLGILVMGAAQGTGAEAGVTITDSGGSTFVHPSGGYGTTTDASGYSAWIFYCNSCNGSTTFTAHMNNGAQTGCQGPMFILAEYSGWGNFAAFGAPNWQTTSTSSTTNGIVSGSASLVSGTHVLGITVSDLSSTETITHGTTPIAFTSDYYQNVGTTLSQYMIESGTAGSTTSFAATFGNNATAIAYGTVMLAFSGDVLMAQACM